MEKNIFILKPKSIEKLDIGIYAYNYDIEEETIEAIPEIAKPKRTQYKCKRVIINGELSANSITEAVMIAEWNKDYEQKLINDYNAYILGILGEESKNRYIYFLEERKRLKTDIDNAFNIYTNEHSIT